MFKGQALFGGVAQGFPMVCASCVRVIPLRERRLVDISGRYHSHLVGDEGWQEVFVHHWDRGEFWGWPRGKVPYRVGTGAKVGIV